MNIVSKSVVAVTLFAAGFSFAAADFKIGYIDLNKALQTTEAGKSSMAQLQKEAQAKNTQFEKQKQDLQNEAEAFEKKAAIMNETARNQKNAELQKKAIELQKSFQESQMELQKKERDLAKPLIDDIRKLAAAMAKEKSLGLVLEENGGGVLYAAPGSDLTEELIVLFNKSNKGKKSK